MLATGTRPDVGRLRHPLPSRARHRGAAHGEDMLRLRLASGAVWNFLWEGAEMRVEDSVRQSAYFGFHRTRQIVLDALVGRRQTRSAGSFTLDED